MTDLIDYGSVCSRLESLIASTRPITAFSNASAFLFHELKDVSWVGFYFFDPDVDKLVLGPFQGKPACVEIGRGKGVCGHAYETGTTVVVPDVHEFPGHIACDADSRSEIVVPIKIRGAVYALLDIDSTTPCRFSDQDASGLERIADVIEEYSADHYSFDLIKSKG